MIPCPTAQIWDYSTTAENAPVWIPGISKATQVTDGPFAVGTQWRGEAYILGVKIKSLLFEVTRCEPDKAVDFALKGKVAVTARVKLEEADGSTRITYRAEIKVGRVFGLIPSSIVDMTIGRIARASLKNLADAVVAGGPAPAAD